MIFERLSIFFQKTGGAEDTYKKGDFGSSGTRKFPILCVQIGTARKREFSRVYEPDIFADFCALVIVNPYILNFLIDT